MNYRWLVLFLTPLWLFACSNPIELSQLETRNGIIYQKGQKFPYSGPAVSYYPSQSGEERRIYEEGAYHLGKKQGVWTTWKWDGGWEEVSWLMGKRDGPNVVFDSQERKTAHYDYQDGVLHGYAYTYDPVSGATEHMVYYKNGQKTTLPEGMFENILPNTLQNLSGDFRRATAAAK